MNRFLTCKIGQSNCPLKTIVTVLVSLAFIALGASPAVAQSCRWDGTAPFCDGACGAGETELTRAATNPGGGPPAFSGPPFGGACATGTKAFCCKASVSCRWDGTAPFCDGKCGAGETPGQPPPGSSSGKSCVSGSKVYCCHSIEKTGAGASALTATPSPLKANPKFTRYAAFLEKGTGPAWQARHGLSAAQYQQEFDKLTKQGYRLVDISGYSVDDKDTYAATWEQRKGPAWVARHGLSAAQYQQEFDRLTKQGYRLIHIDGYTVADQDHYNAIFEQSKGPAWVARNGITSDEYQAAFKTLTKQGYRLIDISGYNVGGQDRYAYIFEKSQGPAWVARHGMTSEQYQQAFNTLTQQGYRLARISAWGAGNTAHYAAKWEKTAGPAWVARHGMLADAYQEEFDKLTKAGYRLKHICGYRTDD